jgi:antitoxin component YwqK of YwqJK toxin-antitoxin module
MSKSLLKISLFTLVVSIGFSLLSFKQGTVWLDNGHNETTEKKGVYYRPAPQKKKNNYFIIDYYRNGNKYREGSSKYATANEENFKGVVTYYHRNGLVSKKEKYKRGLLNGVFTEYFLSGEMKVDGKYVDGEKSGTWKIYYKSGKIKSKGKYRDGEKVGVWKTFYKNVYYPDDE